MKISFNWLKKFISINESPEEVAHLLTHSGLEVEGVEQHESIPGGLKGYVIGYVSTCERHPNADKLSKTTVEVGNGVVLPIVCGAPNVAAGQKVIVALPGAIVRMEGKEPFLIQKTKIRGEVSEGMICAEDELGIGHSHAGILVLETDKPAGTPAADHFQIESDHILEIGLTPNRADAASHFGVARELKAILNRELTLNPWSNTDKGTFASPVTVDVQHTEACPRYAGVYIKGVQVKPSPEWLQKALHSIGLAPINNIVDVTNYMLHGLGQPLHAFDADKIAGAKIVIRNPKEKTSFATLDGKERSLETNDLIIYDQDEPLCIAGVFGGKNAGVSGTTQHVFVESAYFHPDWIRKTAQRLGIKTDSSFRFERGTNPEMVVPALLQAIELILEVAGGEASKVIDHYQSPIKPFSIELNWSRLDKLIGEQLPKDRVRQILSLLDIQIKQEIGDTLRLEVPVYRVDVTREADIVEEVLRIYGYNNIQSKSYLSSEYLAAFPEKESDKTKLNIGKLLVAKGFFEVYSNSLTQANYLEDDAKAVKILNALSSELDVMRQSLLPSALQAVSYNINRRQKDIKVFETGYVYFLQEGKKKYQENQRLSVVQSGAVFSESWQQKAQPATFNDFKNTISEVLFQLGVSNYTLQKQSNHKWLGQSVEVLAQNKMVGVFGIVSKEALKVFDIKQEVFAAEIDLETVFGLKQKSLVFKELPKYPEVRRDLSLVLDKKIRFEQIEKLARKLEPILLKKVNLFDVFEGESLGKDKKSYSISYMLVDEAKTLTDAEIDAVMTRMIEGYEKEIGAIIRR